jgi:hypothetical protein
MVYRRYVASEMLLEATQRHQIHLSLLVAETGLWAHPEVDQCLISQSGCAAMFPTVRRARTSKGENRGQTIDGIRLDDNTYANMAIKRALGLDRSEVDVFEACHIWPKTCYDQRFHTAIANLVLLPRALAGLSDHDPEIQASLQYHAFELYSWHPEGTTAPQKPAFYPTKWRPPAPPHSAARTRVVPSARRLANDSDPSYAGGGMPPEERRLVTIRIREWATRPDLNVHRIIGMVVRRGSMSRYQLVGEVDRLTNSKNAYGAVSSLLTTKGNAYGRVFEDVAGTIRLHPALEDEIRSHRWS